LITRTPNVFVAGAGPVATALAGGLRLAGVPVLGLWARTPASARAAGAVAGVAAYSAAPPDLLLEADVVVLAVRDEAIRDVAALLLATGLVTRKHVMVHCSGAIAAEEALAGVRAELGGVAAMHPLRAVVDPRAVMRDWRGTVFGVEGDERGAELARRLVEALGGTVLAVTGAQMAAYHAACAMASNYLVALVDSAATVLRSVGIAKDAAHAALLPLCEGTLRNLREQGLPGALTGPIRRGDRATVARHLQALAALPDLADLYRQLGLRTVAVARACAAGNDEPAAADLDAIEALLGAPGGT
jgi:predicted short-subunit dehydrogenase-like oxidoreductase (DUF2520 family)